MAGRKQTLRLSEIYKVTFVTNHEDWEAIYVNGVKRCEGHRLSAPEIIDALGLPAEFREVSPEDEMRAFPTTL